MCSEVLRPLLIFLRFLEALRPVVNRGGLFWLLSQPLFLVSGLGSALHWTRWTLFRQHPDPRNQAALSALKCSQRAVEAGESSTFANPPKVGDHLLVARAGPGGCLSLQDMRRDGRRDGVARWSVLRVHVTWHRTPRTDFAGKMPIGDFNDR